MIWTVVREHGLNPCVEDVIEIGSRRYSELELDMVYCVGCGTENPDGADVCLECGSEIYVTSRSDSDDRTCGKSPGDDGGTAPQKQVVILEKTPGRIRDRRMAISLSMIVSVASLVLLFLWNFDFIAVFRLDIGLEIPDVDMGMTILDSARASGNVVVLSGIVFTTVFALAGFLTPLLSIPTSVLFTLTALRSMYPFEMEINNLPFLCMGTVEQASGVLMIYLAFTAASLVAGFLVFRSLSVSRSFFDREAGMIMRTLLSYNVSGNWNVVFRRKFRI